MKYWDNPVYRFRCRSHGDQLAVWGGHARSETGAESLARWQSEHMKPGCQWVQEAGPQISVHSRLSGYVFGVKKPRP